MRQFNALVVRSILKFVKTKDSFIAFESDVHHIFDNSFYLYMYLRNFQKLHLYYVVYNKKQYMESRNKGIKKSRIILLSNRINIHIASNLIYILKTKIIFKKCQTTFISYRNFYIEYSIPIYPNQVVVNLRHGQFPIKNVYGYYKDLCFTNNKNTFFRVGTTESLDVLPLDYKKLNCQWFAAPMPRIDCLKDNKKKEFCRLVNVSEKNYGEYTFVLLLTTLRHVNGSYFETQFPFKITYNDFKMLNDFLEKNKMFLIIKSHHDVVFEKSDYDYGFNNILFIDDADLLINGLFVNHLFKYVEALLTDYSSALFDFLYVDKPIGFLEENRNMSENDSNGVLKQTDFLCGELISNINQLILFLRSLNAGVDNYKVERQKVFKRFNGERLDNYSSDIAAKFINPKYLKR